MIFFRGQFDLLQRRDVSYNSVGQHGYLIFHFFHVYVYYIHIIIIIIEDYVSDECIGRLK